MRQPCGRCGKSFTVTSWTSDNFWRKICTRCIVELLNKVVPNREKIKES